MKKHVRERLEFIKNKLDNEGTINRSDIMLEFEVSEMTAAVDLKNFRSMHPDYIEYDYAVKTWKKRLQSV